MDTTIKYALERLLIAKRGLESWLKRNDLPESVKAKLRLQLEAGEAIIQIAREYIKSINN